MPDDLLPSAEKNRIPLDIGEVVNELLSSVSSDRLVKKAATEKNGIIYMKGIASPGWDLKGTIETDKGLRVLSIGKAALPMLDGFIETLNEFCKGCSVKGMILSPYDIPRNFRLKGVEYLRGNHPVPGHSDIVNVQRTIDFLESGREEEALVILLSGGASSLTFSPVDGLEPELKSGIIRELLLKGAQIGELNTVRSHLSKIKAGGLLEYVRSASVVSLVLSDVMGDDPALIGSGPTVRRYIERKDVIEILERYDIGADKVYSVSCLDKTRRPCPDFHVSNLLIGNNKTAVKGLARIIRHLGYWPFVDPSKYSGEARETGPLLLRRARIATAEEGCNCVIQGGETTVTVLGNGKGGRNLELALSMYGDLMEDEEIITLATDGVDGISDAAGAHAKGNGGGNELVDTFIRRSDSEGFFRRFGGLIETGATHNNLGDLFLYINHRARDPLPR